MKEKGSLHSLFSFQSSILIWYRASHFHSSRRKPRLFLTANRRDSTDYPAPPRPGSIPALPPPSPVNLYLEILYVRLERYLIAMPLKNSKTPEINTCASNGEAPFSAK